jgi:hypothetical protein
VSLHLDNPLLFLPVTYMYLTVKLPLENCHTVDSRMSISDNNATATQSSRLQKGEMPQPPSVLTAHYDGKGFLMQRLGCKKTSDRSVATTLGPPSEFQYGWCELGVAPGI